VFELAVDFTDSPFVSLPARLLLLRLLLLELLHLVEVVERVYGIVLSQHSHQPVHEIILPDLQRFYVGLWVQERHHDFRQTIRVVVFLILLVRLQLSFKLLLRQRRVYRLDLLLVVVVGNVGIEVHDAIVQLLNRHLFEHLICLYSILSEEIHFLPVPLYLLEEYR